MPASLAIATRPLALLAAAALLTCATAHADNTATVRLSLVNANILATNSANQLLWNRPITDCTAIGTISSTFAGTPDNYKWFYTFSNVTPLSGSVGEFGQISFSTNNLFATGRFAPGTVVTNVQITTLISLLGHTYIAQNNSALSFANGSPEDLSWIGGDLALRSSRLPFFAGGSAEPYSLTLAGTPTLRVEIIPAPAGLLAMSPGLLALHRRRR